MKEKIWVVKNQWKMDHLKTCKKRGQVSLNDFIVRPEINVPQGAFTIGNNHRPTLNGMVVPREARMVGCVASTHQLSLVLHYFFSILSLYWRLCQNAFI